MAVDIQVVQPQETVRLENIDVTRVGDLWSVRVKGEDFRAVDGVLVNDMEVPDFIVASQHELIAQLPDSMQQSPEVRSVQVLSTSFTVTRRSLMRFRIGSTPGRVRGTLRLVQRFLKVLFTTPGSDIFNPSVGGGARSRVGATYGKNGGAGLVTEFVIAVDRTQRQMLAAQSRDQRSPRDERLMAANVTGSSFDKVSGALFITVELANQAGRVVPVNVGL